MIGHADPQMRCATQERGEAPKSGRDSPKRERSGRRRGEESVRGRQSLLEAAMVKIAPPQREMKVGGTRAVAKIVGIC